MHMAPPWLRRLSSIRMFHVVTVLGCDSGLPSATACVRSKRAVTERPSGERSTASASKNSHSHRIEFTWTGESGTARVPLSPGSGGVVRRWMESPSVSPPALGVDRFGSTAATAATRVASSAAVVVLAATRVVSSAAVTVMAATVPAGAVARSNWAPSVPPSVTPSPPPSPPASSVPSAPPPATAPPASSRLAFPEPIVPPPARIPPPSFISAHISRWRRGVN